MSREPTGLLIKRDKRQFLTKLAIATVFHNSCNFEFYVILSFPFPSCLVGHKTGHSWAVRSPRLPTAESLVTTRLGLLPLL